MITIVDYGMGNLRSVYNALDLLGANVQISGHADEVLAAERLVLPGVGAFGLAMHNLRERGLVDALNEKVMHQKTPILAICLGMELLAESSNEHGNHAGLGWLPGNIRFFDNVGDLRVPHVGWNDITVKNDPPLFKGLTSDRAFYFVHSYYFDTDEASIIAATTDYGHEFVCAVHRDDIFGTQFHPEKSQASGLQILRNFMSWEIETQPV